MTLNTMEFAAESIYPATEGLRIQTQLDQRDSRAGINVSDEELQSWPLIATNSMGSGTIASSLVITIVEQVLFKLLLPG